MKADDAAAVRGQKQTGFITASVSKQWGEQFEQVAADADRMVRLQAR